MVSILVPFGCSILTSKELWHSRLFFFFLFPETKAILNKFPAWMLIGNPLWKWVKLICTTTLISRNSLHTAEE